LFQIAGTADPDARGIRDRMDAWDRTTPGRPLRMAVVQMDSPDSGFTPYWIFANYGDPNESMEYEPDSCWGCADTYAKAVESAQWYAANVSAGLIRPPEFINPEPYDAMAGVRASA
jgi:hypothetical protein